ncbi:hypothetical protein K1T35_48380 (plasmid) [Pseudonocardia sp. DSM 110487]|uniref:hypothetical protein n=1 Tax=Pseudonocardia sp. DSM 110487 TaxID=2865833 RepID=UPI001C696CF8|nr:hypothetical protein [Pseudonocardia sp. DSM 110487]QYN41166.1 hypothetical protein K1T35_48380 [Pseudonocardia sp. DSM 110487]
MAIALAVAIAAAGCSSSPAPQPDPAEFDYTKQLYYPGERGFSPDDLTRGSWMNLPREGFDLCSPFNDSLFLKQAPVQQGPVERGPGLCRWRGARTAITVTDETGRTILEVSNDPRYRPGGRNAVNVASRSEIGRARYWVTLTPRSQPYSSHLFLAFGPNQPQRLLHIHVETEAARVPAKQRNQTYAPRELAEFIVGSIALDMSEVLKATATSDAIPR